MSNSTAPAPIPNLPHDSRQGNIIAASVVTWVIAAVFVGLRFYTRGRIVRALNSSDWCILISLVCCKTGCRRSGRDSRS